MREVPNYPPGYVSREQQKNYPVCYHSLDYRKCPGWLGGHCTCGYPEGDGHVRYRNSLVRCPKCRLRGTGFRCTTPDLMPCPMMNDYVRESLGEPTDDSQDPLFKKRAAWGIEYQASFLWHPWFATHRVWACGPDGSTGGRSRLFRWAERRRSQCDSEQWEYREACGWVPWFAWYPVKMDAPYNLGKWCWLRIVERLRGEQHRTQYRDRWTAQQRLNDYEIDNVRPG